MTDDKLFAEYSEKKPGGVSGFFKNPKSWVIVIMAAAALILAVAYIINLSAGMTAKEVKNSIEVAEYDTLWVDKEITPQEVKIVPAIRFKIKNTGRRPLQFVDIEAVFSFVETGNVHSDGMASILKEKPLQPGEISEVVFIKSLYGYSATSRAAFMQNKEEWKPMEVKLFARAKGSGLVRVGDVYPVKQVIEGYDETVKPGEELPGDYQDEATRQLAQSLQVTEQDSQWVDKASTAKEVIIVPSITVEVKNTGQKPLQYLYFKGVFKYEDTGEILSEGITAALEDPLAPGDTSKPYQVKADFGYSASSKEAFFQGTEQRWKQLKVHLYAKSKESQQYALLGIFPIKAQIQGVKVVYH